MKVKSSLIVKKSLVLAISIFFLLLSVNIASASYSFDTEVDVGYIYYYNSTAGTYSANLASSSFDYFPDNAVAGDMLYFGGSYNQYSAPWHNLKFYVGTPLQATSITLAWEYYNGSAGAWEAIPNLVDNTNAFQNSGENSVTFPVPPHMYSDARFWSLDMYHAGLSFNNWVRARIVSVSGLTEGGAQSTQQVKCNDNVITVKDETDVTLSSIYNADVSNGWGQVSKLSNQSYLIKPNLFLINSSFTSTNEIFQVGREDYPVVFSVDSDSSFQLGVLTGDYGKDGSTLYLHSREGRGALGYPKLSNAKIYASNIIRPQGHIGSLELNGAIDLRDSIYTSNTTITIGSSATGYIKRTLFATPIWVYIFSTGVDIDTLKMTPECGGILAPLWSGGDVIIRNVKFTSTQKLDRYYAANVYLINCEGPTNANIVSTEPRLTNDVYVYKKFTFNLKVVDKDGNPISGANVTLKDTDGNTTFTALTNSSGQIDEQTITTYQKWWVYAESWAEHTKDYNPFTLTISKDNYISYNVQSTIDIKQDLTIALAGECDPDPDYSDAYHHYPMKYDSSTNTIIVWGNDGTGTNCGPNSNETCTAMGNNDSNPINFDKVWEFAHGAKGTCLLGDKYIFKTHLQIGDGTTPTVFHDFGKQVTFEDGIISNYYEDLIKVMNNANFTLGVLENETEKIGKDGVQMVFLESTYYPEIISYTGGIIRVYASSFISPYARTYLYTNTNDSRVYNSLLTGNYTGGTIPYGGMILRGDNGLTADYFNIISTGGSYGIQNLHGTIEDITILHTPQYSVAFTVNGATMKNIYVRDSGPIRTWGLSEPAYLVDCDIDNWVFSWGGTNTKNIYRQYSFSLKLTDNAGNYISGANVTLYDKDNNVVFTDLTNSSGQLSSGTQTVTYGYYNQTGGNTPYLKTPHLLVVTKSGYVPIKLNLTMDSKKSLELEMHGKRNLYPINLAMISGTEYKTGEDIYVAVQVTDAYGDPVSGATCTFDIYKPDMTLWQNDVPTTYLGNGVYYNNSLTAPSTYGSYTYIANCTYSGTNSYESKTFHVAEWTGDITNILNNITNTVIPYLQDINSTVYSNNVLVTEINTTTHSTLTKWGSQTAQALYDLESSTNTIADYINTTRWNTNVFSDVMNKWGSYSASSLYTISEQAKNISQYINETRWNTKVAQDLYDISNDAYTMASYINSTRWNTKTAQDLYDISSEIKTLATEINTTTHNIYTIVSAIQSDVTYLYNRENCSSYTSEIGTKCWYLDNINDTLGTVGTSPADIWSYSSRTLTDWSFANLVWSYSTRSLTDYGNQNNIYSIVQDLEDMHNCTYSPNTKICQYLSEINTTTHNTYTAVNALNDITASDVWSYATRTLTDYSGVWSVATRTLTDYNQTLMWTYLEDINTSTATTIPNLINSLNDISASDVWTYTTRDLTDYNQTHMWIYLSEINSTTHNLPSASDIWTYTNRNLTYIDWGTGATYVWNATSRELTTYPSTRAVLTLDISKSGLINTTYYDVASSHIFDSTEPDNDEIFKTNFYKKYGIDIGYVPNNVTNGYLIYWLKKIGNPTGYLNITIDGSLIKTIDVSTLSTDYTKFVTQFDKSNITDSYVEVEFIGQSAWTQANDVSLGGSNQIAIYSMESPDNSTWVHPTYEYIIGLTIEYNQESIADQMNEESVYIQKKSPEAICPGQTIWSTFEFYDYQGNALDIQALPTCSLQKINDDGTITDLGSANIDVTETGHHRIRVVKNGTYTGTLENNGLYKIKCININITTQGGNIVTIENQGTHFRTLTTSECNYFNNSILATQTNITSIISHGDANWLTATGFLTGAELNASHGTGNYNTTGTSPSEIWSYATRTITGGNLTTMDWTKVSDLSNLATQSNITSIISHGDTYWITADLSNVPADVWSYATRTLSDYSGVWNFPSRNLTYINWGNGAGYIWNYSNRNLTYYEGTSPEEVWNYSNKTLTTQDWVTLADIANLATQDNTSEIKNLINSLNNLSASDVWSYATRTLTDYNQTDMWIYLQDINTSQISAGDVWNYTNRVLTNYSGVWSFTTRTLTDYNQTDMWIYLQDINTTVSSISTNTSNQTQILSYLQDLWEHTYTNSSIINLENITSSTLSATSNITINYNISVPIKAGFSAGDYLPIRIKYYFLDSDGNCINQGTDNTSPHCTPLTVSAVGRANDTLSLNVSMRPNLDVGNYSIVRIIEVDPNNVWIVYGIHNIGSIKVEPYNVSLLKEHKLFKLQYVLLIMGIFMVFLFMKDGKKDNISSHNAYEY
ncbi:MAG: carboxypeptidase regulatory-like domain-containing protein [Candidatus Cloacimonetes bacterium]|nr:carboxypeptidase regulatory-like domain-containing protein [Candidatus Cloacimonadota bacterium]